MTQALKVGDRVRRTDGATTRWSTGRVVGVDYEQVVVLPDGYRYPANCAHKNPGAGTFSPSSFEKIGEDRDFPLRNGDELVNVKTGRKGFVVGGMVYDRVPSWVKAVPAKALDEYEHHHPGTYEITYRKQAQPW